MSTSMCVWCYFIPFLRIKDLYTILNWPFFDIAQHLRRSSNESRYLAVFKHTLIIIFS